MTADSNQGQTNLASGSPAAGGQVAGGAPPPPPWVHQKETAGQKEDAAVQSPGVPASPPNQAIPSENKTVTGAPMPPVSMPGGSPPVSPSSFSTSSLETAGGGRFKVLGLILGGLAVLGIIGFLIFKFVLPKLRQGTVGSGEKTGGQQARDAKVNLSYWGLWEGEKTIQPLIDEYQQKNPNVTITYSQQSPKDYRERLQSALAAGTGPDIFRFHNTWVPMFRADLDSVPKDVLDPQDYFPAVIRDLTAGTELVGVPLMFDSLALYYNPDMFKEAGQVVPETWEELRRTAIAMTVYDQSGNIKTAGVAMGETKNVDNFSDILGLMLLQNGADLANPQGQWAEDALRFYTVFSKTDRVWDSAMPASTYAFASEKVAMILAPSWRAFEIAEINPELYFLTAPVPQLPDTQIAWATYWVEGVSRKSKNTRAAWDFLKFLSSSDSLTKLYTLESQGRLFGEPYAKKSLASSLKDDPLVGAFVNQAEIAHSWYMASRTFDNGLNDKIIKYYEDAVNSIMSGKSVGESLATVKSGVDQVLSQYQVNE